MSLLPQWTAAWTICYVWSTIFMSLRLYLRWNKRTLHKTDILVAVTLVLSSICYALSVWCGYLILKTPGVYQHVNQIALSFFFLNLSVTIIIPLAKGCVVLLLQEVETHRLWRRALWTIHVLLGLQLLGILIMNFFGCVQVFPGTVWAIIAKGHFIHMAAKGEQQRMCIVRTEYIIINGTLNAFFEVLILICAFSLIMRVRVTTAQKLGLAFTFSLGIFTVAISIISTVLLYGAHDKWEDSLNPATAGIAFFRSGIWSCFEVYINLAIASILPIRAALLTFYEKATKLTSQCIHHKQEAIQRTSTDEAKVQCEEIVLRQTAIRAGHVVDDEKLLA